MSLSRRVEYWSFYFLPVVRIFLQWLQLLLLEFRYYQKFLIKALWENKSQGKYYNMYNKLDKLITAFLHQIPALLIFIKSVQNINLLIRFSSSLFLFSSLVFLLLFSIVCGFETSVEIWLSATVLCSLPFCWTCSNQKPYFFRLFSPDCCNNERSGWKSHTWGSEEVFSGCISTGASIFECFIDFPAHSFCSWLSFEWQDLKYCV